MAKINELNYSYILKVVKLLRKKLQLSENSQIDPYLLARKLKIIVIEAQMPELDGCLLFDGFQGRILLNNGVLSPGRKLFTIAHELGHRVLHCKEPAPKSFFCNEKDIEQYQGSELEIQANQFASEILMPHEAVFAMASHGNFELKVVDRIIEKFGVSRLAALRRSTELTKHSVAVVFSKEGYVEYWWKSPSCEAFLERRHEISEDSTASECTDTYEESSSIGMIPSDMEMWSPRSFRGDSVRLSEQSFQSYDGKTVTILRFEDT